MFEIAFANPQYHSRRAQRGREPMVASIDVGRSAARRSGFPPGLRPAGMTPWRRRTRSRALAAFPDGTADPGSMRRFTVDPGSLRVREGGSSMKVAVLFPTRAALAGMTLWGHGARFRLVALKRVDPPIPNSFAECSGYRHNIVTQCSKCRRGKPRLVPLQNREFRLFCFI
jgi:hypothetical protein